MRYIIYGAGGVGATIGARLFHGGHHTVLICRGDHLTAIQERGLQFVTHDLGTINLPIPAVGHPNELEWTEDDVVILGMKTQDTEGALLDLEASTGGIEPPIICAQNGVENERRALRRFPRVYGMVARLPGTYLEAGVIENHARPVGGLLDVGRYPEGSDELIEQVSADLRSCNFASRVETRITRWKYAKLIRNLANGLVGCVGIDVDVDDFRRALVDEALTAYEAAGLDYATPAEEAEHREVDGYVTEAIGDSPRLGNSSWQSLIRATGTIETDYLNGEIVMIGIEAGVPTPYNRVIQRASAWMARERKQPGALTLEDLERMVEEEQAAAS
ncbi:MAG: ketopantoate reductase family protein [Chloroflexi bacterium]|nr:ketopantoate reductase family protein [Chloroflexota bacterium]